VKWTTVGDIKAQLERRWLKGELCRAAVGEEALFPLQLSLSRPTAKAMLDSFAPLQEWVKTITHYADQHGVTLAWQEVNHRALGRQQLPCVLLLESPQQAAVLIGKGQLLQRFCRDYKATLLRCPELQPWLLKRPLKMLELEPAWSRLVDLCLWMQTHPNPRIYPRQVSVIGVDSKLIESQRKVLAELFDLVLPRFAVNDDFSGVAGFARRYGFRDKPLMVRMRPLDATIRLLRGKGDQDISLTATAFSQHDLVVRSVVVTENEVNYLAFPDLPQGVMVFCAGYGIGAIAKAAWLADCELLYWGDIDTHGFAILDQLRAHFPHTQSLLMDRDTLMKHRLLWGHEPKQEIRNMERLTADECALYDDLRSNRLGDHVRLEQERIGFAYVTAAVDAVVG